MNEEELVVDLDLYLIQYGMKKFLKMITKTVTNYSENVGGVKQWDCDETIERLKEESDRY